MQHHFQLFLCVQFFQMQAADHFPQLSKTVQNYKQFKELFNILVNSFENIISQNSKFLLMKVWFVLKVGDNIHHHGFGFRLFCLCESSVDSLYSFSIYKGKNKNCSEYALSHNICMDLMEPLLDMGYTIICALLFVVRIFVVKVYKYYRNGTQE